MKQIYLPVFGESTSAVGFGCASLGSRVDRADGIAALSAAYERGVKWFDVAPSYGDGEAEYNLGYFLKGKRSQVHVCTKVGILPPRTPWLMKKVKPIARAIVSHVPSIRSAISKGRPPAIKVSLTADVIQRSLEASLKRLGTDYIDVLALHDATSEEIQNDEVLSALDQAISSGKVRAVSVASSLEVGVVAMLHQEIFRFIQVANSPYERNIEALRKNAIEAKRENLIFISHSAYGKDGALGKLTSLLKNSSDARDAAARLGVSGDEVSVAASMLLAYAYSSNSGGVCLLSMFKKKHLEFNISKLNKNFSEEGLVSFFDRFSIV